MIRWGRIRARISHLTQILPGNEAGSLVREAGIEAGERAMSGNVIDSPWIPGYYTSMERILVEDVFGITGVTFYVAFYM